MMLDLTRGGPKRGSVLAGLVRTIVIAAGLVAPVIVLDGLKAAFLDELPFREPQNLVTISGVSFSGTGDRLDIFGGRPTIEGATSLRYGKGTWSRPGGGRRIDVALIDDRTFELLGLTVEKGRGFSREDRMNPQAALVSRVFLEAGLLAEAGQLNQDLEINGAHYTVIGVAPAALARLGRFDVVLPRSIGSGMRLGKGETFFTDVTVARKRPGASLVETKADMERLQRSQERPGQGQSQVSVASLADRMSAPSRPALQALSFAAIVLVLLSMVTVFMLAATLSSERLPEFAIRSALGASARRLRVEAVRPWLEALLPATLLAVLGVSPLSRWMWSTLPSLGAVKVMSGETLFGTLFLGLLLTATAAAGTLIPQQLLLKALSASGSTPADHRGGRIGWILATGQVALSVALFCGAAMAGQALHDQSSRNLGFTPDRVFQIDLFLGEGSKSEELAAAWQRLRTVVPENQASFASNVPWASTWYWWVGSDRNTHAPTASITAISSGFFSTLGMTFREGEDPFSVASPTDVVVISSWLAKTLDVRAGSIITVNNDKVRVAGIVNDVFDPTRKPNAARPQVYVAPGFNQRFEPEASIFVRGSIAEAMQVRSSVESALPKAYVSSPSPLQGTLVARLERERLGTIVLGAYALLASLLVVFGLEGLMRRRVSQRMKEVGVRLVLGATARQIDETMLGPIALPALGGVVVGLLLGFQLAGSVASLMPWARPLDATVYIVSAMAGTALVLFSSWPALRNANRARPADLLRHL